VSRAVVDDDSRGRVSGAVTRDLIRAELARLGAELLVISPTYVCSFRPSGAPRFHPDSDPHRLAAAFERYGVGRGERGPSALRGLFVLDGERDGARLLRFGYVVTAADRPITGAAALIDALASASRAVGLAARDRDLTRRELLAGPLLLPAGPAAAARSVTGA